MKRSNTSPMVIALVLLCACNGPQQPTVGSHIADAVRPIPESPGVLFSETAIPNYWWPVVFAPSNPPTAFGTTYNASGLIPLDVSTVGLAALTEPPRVRYGMGIADFNGDGIPDIVSGVYTPTSVYSSVQLYVGDAGGSFTLDPSFGAGYQESVMGSGYKGRTETIVTADFNGDGAVDIFIPTYTFLDKKFDQSHDPAYVTDTDPPNVYNALQSFLLLNDGSGHFKERAVEAGVSMHARVSGITPDSTDPYGNQPEGAQAVDFNLDGMIDLYVGGHLFINQGVDDQGVPHFMDVAPALGLTSKVLRAPYPWSASRETAVEPQLLATDEGAKFIDWNNDGHLDLLLLRHGWGGAHGARLFEFDGHQFREQITRVVFPTATCQVPSHFGSPLFTTARPFVPGEDAAGINAYDLDNDGLEDILVMGTFATTTNITYRNTGCGFEEVLAGDLHGRFGGAGSEALSDLDRDGRIDVVYPGGASTGAYYLNRTLPGSGGSFIVDVRGANGEANQFGRVIQVMPPGSTEIMTRVVDGGSGYLSRNQYPLLVGTKHSGLHAVNVYYGASSPCHYQGRPCKPIVLSFWIAPGQQAITFAPSAADPAGRVLFISADSSSPLS